MPKNEITVQEYRALMAKQSEPKAKRHKSVPKADFSQDHIDPVAVLRHYGFSPDSSLYIRGHVYSSKNSKMILTRYPKNGADLKTRWRFDGKPVLPFIADSTGTHAYKKATWYMYKDLAPRFREMTKRKELPLKIMFTFIRMDRQEFDFPNIVQLVMDQMVYYKWIDDDNMNQILPLPPTTKAKAYYVSEEYAGVIITIL